MVAKILVGTIYGIDGPWCNLIIGHGFGIMGGHENERHDTIYNACKRLRYPIRRLKESKEGRSENGPKSSIRTGSNVLL